MFKKTLGCLVVIGAVLAVIPSTCFALNRADLDAHCAALNATYSPSSQRCVCNSGYTESGDTCVRSGGGSGSSSPSYDYEAERHAQEQAEAARRADAERQAELERQRREAENKRLVEEAARQAKFLEDRDAAAGSLRGSTGTRASSSGGLRGSTATSGGSVLRGSSADTGLRGLKSGTTMTPNTDPMVVDARNVPTGLPKSVEAEIPNTPAGNRVRKGFQAIMNHDWKVARAWFQDAHNHEPGDAGIKRLVDLAEYTLHKEQQPRPPASKRTPNAADKAQIVATMAALEHIEDTWMAKEIVEALLDYSRYGLRKQAAGNQVQLPLDSDLELLDPAPTKPAVKSRKQSK